MSYNVSDEFIIERDGAAVHHLDIGSTVELSDEEAAELIAAGKVALIAAGKVAPPAALDEADNTTAPESGDGSAGTGGAADTDPPLSKAARDAALKVADELDKAGKAGKAE